MLVFVGLGRGQQAGGNSAPGTGPPVVNWFCCGPWRKGHEQPIRQTVDIRLIHSPQRDELPLACLAASLGCAARREKAPQLGQRARRQPVVAGWSGWNVHDLGQIHHGVPRNCKGQLGLRLQGSLSIGDEQRASIQYRRKRRQPRLVVVLRTEVT